MTETLKDILAIPPSLKKGEAMTHSEPKSPRKQRATIELPHTLTVGFDANDYVLIDDLDLAQLVEHSKRINNILVSVPRLELERRAIRKAIIAKA